MYITYTKNLENIAHKYNIKIMMYADDSQLYFSFQNTSTTFAMNNINDCLIEIKSWMNKNFLKMNDDKTKLMILKPKTATDLPFNINHCGTIIEPINLINILGIRIGQNLDLTPFINKKIQVCTFHLKNLINIRNSLPFQTKIIMVTNVIFI